MLIHLYSTGSKQTLAAIEDGHHIMVIDAKQRSFCEERSLTQTVNLANRGVYLCFNCTTGVATKECLILMILIDISEFKFQLGPPDDSPCHAYHMSRFLLDSFFLLSKQVQVNQLTVR